MAEKLATTKLLLWVAIVLFFLWFLIFSLTPARILTALALPETHGLFLRLFGIFPLGWAVLFFFALKDAVRNRAIVDSGIITAALLIIAFLIYNLVVGWTKSWFLWLSIVVLLVLNLLLFIFKPKPTVAQ